MILILSIGDMFRSRFGEYAGWAQAVSKQGYVEKKMIIVSHDSET